MDALKLSAPELKESSNQHNNSENGSIGSRKDAVEQGFRYGAQALKESYKDGRRDLGAEYN